MLLRGAAVLGESWGRVGMSVISGRGGLARVGTSVIWGRVGLAVPPVGGRGLVGTVGCRAVGWTVRAGTREVGGTESRVPSACGRDRGSVRDGNGCDCGGRVRDGSDCDCGCVGGTVRVGGDCDCACVRGGGDWDVDCVRGGSVVACVVGGSVVVAEA